MPMFVIDSDSSAAALPQDGDNDRYARAARSKDGGANEVGNIGDLQCQSTPANIGSDANEGDHRYTCLAIGEGQLQGW